jgi:hypothetical protein
MTLNRPKNIHFSIETAMIIRLMSDLGELTDTELHLVVADIMEWLTVSKQTTQKFDMERFSLKKLKRSTLQ